MYDILSLTNSTLLTADMILLCTKTLYPIHGSHSPAGTVPLPSHLISCTPTKSNLYLDSSLETVIRVPTLYKLLTFHQLCILTVVCCCTQVLHITLPHGPLSSSPFHLPAIQPCNRGTDFTCFTAITDWHKVTIKLCNHSISLYTRAVQGVNAHM
jgi:hypothetical protein